MPLTTPMKKLLSIATCFLLINNCLCAQSSSVLLKPATPQSASVSEKQLKLIDSLLQAYVNKHWIAGATALVARDGKIVYHKGIGYRDVDKKQPIGKDDIFRIASQTKAITCVAVMTLYDEGRFLLDDAVSKYIPEFAKPVVLDKFNEADTTYTTVPAKREVTIRDLLTHTSGLGYGQIGSKTYNAIYAKNNITSGIGAPHHLLKDEMLRLAKLPLTHQPGEQFTYGLNMDMLGYLVEVLSGMSLNEYLQNRIFKPLGMKDTYFYLPKEKQSRLMTLYGEDENKLIKKLPDTLNINGTWLRDYPNEKGTYYSGGGGLSCTALDYCIFLQMMLNGGTYNGHKILSPGTVRLMTMNQIGSIDRGTSKFGLGFGIALPSATAKLGISEGSYDWGGMWSSSYWVDPVKHIVAQLFINQYQMSHGDIHDRFKALIYSSLEN